MQDHARDWLDVVEHERAMGRARTERFERLIRAAENALTRLDREDAEKRAAGTPAPHEGVLGSVNDQLRAALAEVRRPMVLEERHWNQQHLAACAELAAR